MYAKNELLKFMNSLDFGIADIKYENDYECYAHKRIDSDDLVWFPIESGGSGFVQLFRGAIKEACVNEKL
jgi:hypothetical protein